MSNDTWTTGFSLSIKYDLKIGQLSESVEYICLARKNERFI